MILKFNPQLLVAYTLLMAVVMMSWTSCEGINDMSGGGNSGPDPNDEIPIRCYDGWDKNPLTDVCECLAPKVVVGQYECREIRTDDWYSSMDGCLVNQGISFQIPWSIHPDSLSTGRGRTLHIELPDSNSRHRNIHYGAVQFLRRGEKIDSIQFYVPSTASKPYYKWPTVSDDGYNTGFHGVILNDSTLVGQFVFGPMNGSWELDRGRIFSECEAIIRKGRVE